MPRRYQPDYMNVTAAPTPGHFDDFRDPKATAAEKAFEDLDPQGVRWVVERAMATHEERNAADQFHIDEQTFRHNYPVYHDSEHNKRLMVHHWKEVLGTSVPTYDEIEQSFVDLRQAGVLQLNAAAVARENKARIAQRSDEIAATRKEREFSEDKANELDLDTLRLRANGIWE